MKKLRLSNLLWTLCLVMIAGLWSCNDEDVDGEEPFVTSEPAALTFNANDGLTQKVTIKSNRDWTISTNVDWVACTPDKGSGNAEVEVTVLANPDAQRTAKLTITASIATATIDITQVGKGGSVVNDTIYTDNFGSGADKDDPASYEGYQKSGIGAANVTYSGSNTDIRNNSFSDNKYSTSEYSKNQASGGNNIYLKGAGSTFDIKEITLTGVQTNLELTFGICRSEYNNFDAPFNAEEFKVSLSADGSNWSAPLTYTRSTYESWDLATANFTLTKVTEKLYIRFEATAVAGRVDDITLKTGAGGQSVILGEGGGDEPTGPVQKKISEVLNAFVNGQTVTAGWAIKGIIVSDAQGKNINSNIFVMVDNNQQNSGITIMLKEDHTFAVGDSVSVDLTDAKYKDYSNLLEIENVALEKVTRLNSGNSVVPVVITPNQLKNYQSMYVAIEAAQAVSTLGKMNTTVKFATETGGVFDVYSKGGVAYKDVAVPTGNGTIKGIAGVYGNNYQLQPRNANDFANMNATRFGALSYGTPEFSAKKITAGEALSEAKVTIPYENAKGTESVSVEVTVSGVGSVGITSPATYSGTLSEGSGVIEVAVNGTPSAEGTLTFTISGLSGLGNTTCEGTVAPAGTLEPVVLSTMTLEGAGSSSGEGIKGAAFSEDNLTLTYTNGSIIQRLGSGTNATKITYTYNVVTPSIWIGGWDLTDAAWLLTVPVATDVFGSVELKFNTYGTKACPKTWKVQYSNDNATWKDGGNFNVEKTAAPGDEIAVNMNIAEGDKVAENGKLYIKITPDLTAGSVNGGAIAGSSGNFRFVKAITVTKK